MKVVKCDDGSVILRFDNDADHGRLQDALFAGKWACISAYNDEESADILDELAHKL